MKNSIFIAGGGLKNERGLTIGYKRTVRGHFPISRQIHPVQPFFPDTPPIPIQVSSMLPGHHCGFIREFWLIIEGGCYGTESA
jgi:hypothetical protein